MHRKLVEAVRAGSQVAESVIASGLTDKGAYRLESRIIGEFHKIARAISTSISVCRASCLEVEFFFSKSA